MKSRVVLSVLLLASVILIGAGFAQAATSTAFPWTTMQGDAQRSGFTQSPAPNGNETFWKFQTGGAIEASPVAANGLVYVTSGDGYLYAVNATTGVKSWAALVGANATSPTLTQGRVFVVSSGTVFAFDAASGAAAWNYSLGQEPNLAAPLAVGSRLFVSGNGTIYALNEAYGVKLYDDAVPHVTGITRLVYVDGLVVAYASRGEGGTGLHGFEAVNTMGRFWMYLEPTGKDRYSSFIVDDSAKIFAVVAGAEGNSSAFGVTGMGLPMWEHQIRGATTAFPATAYNKTYAVTSKFAYALNATDGSVQWSCPTSGAGSASSPALAGGKVFFGLDDGYVYALDAFNGSMVWSYRTGGPVRSSPTVSDGLLFVGSDNGYLYAIGHPVNNGADAIPELPSWGPILIATAGLTVILVISRKRLLLRNGEHREATRMKKPLSTLLICLLVAGFAAQLIGSANANFMPIPIPQPAIVIQADGSVSPAGAPIERNGNVYTFARDIVGYTVASERDNVVIDGNGFTLRGSGNSTGVFLKNSNGVTVQNMTVTGFAYGIYLFAESYFGMNSTGNKLLNNTMTGNQYGIYISSSSSNTLQGNRMSNNTYNFWVASTYVNDIDTSNTVEGKPIVYWVGVQNRAAPANAGYVAFVNCANVTAQGLSLTGNGQGIVVVSTSGATVAQNTVTKCDSSIYLNNAAANTITNNNLTGNANGVRGETCSGNLIQANTAASNKIGIYFTGTCTNNTITKNAITANSEDGVNLWGSMGTVLSGNTITGNVETGINLFDSRGNNITANTIADNPGIGAKLWYDADANSFRGNTFANNSIGILINDSFDNTVVGNSFVGNRDWGMRFEDQQNNNVILQNNFVGNRPGGDGLQVSITGSGILTPKPGGGNIWDNGAAGNYWSDYQRRYPNATLKGTSGTGDTPYYINENNADHHPMIALLNISSVEVTPSPTTTPTPSPSPTTSATATPTPASTLTPSPTPAPSVPELPWWVTAVLFFAALALVAVFGKGARH